MRLCCPKCCEGYSDELDHCPKCGPTYRQANIDALTAERDRLAAENAELRKQSDEDMEAFLDMSRIADNYSMQLAAADATLDRLRIWIPKDMYKRGYSLEDLERCHAELYPPETTNDDR